MVTEVKEPLTNKLEGVRRALQALGYQAKPLEIQHYVKENFGIEMKTDHISANKSTIIKKHGKSAMAKPIRKPMGKTTRPVAPAPESKTASPRAAGGVSIHDLQLVKDLIDRVGAEELKALINLW